MNTGFRLTEAGVVGPRGSETEEAIWEYRFVRLVVGVEPGLGEVIALSLAT
jgi:hypothetical protein